MTPETVLVEADYAEGAYGPTILIVLRSVAGVGYLIALLEDLAKSAVGATVDLPLRPEVSVGAAVYDLTLRVVDRAPPRHLLRTATGGFEWLGTNEDWETAGLLVEPLLRQPGHQYLTSELDDDALVEVSYGEYDS